MTGRDGGVVSMVVRLSAMLLGLAWASLCSDAPAQATLPAPICVGMGPAIGSIIGSMRPLSGSEGELTRVQAGLYIVPKGVVKRDAADEAVGWVCIDQFGRHVRCTE